MKYRLRKDAIGLKAGAIFEKKDCFSHYQCYDYAEKRSLAELWEKIVETQTEWFEKVEKEFCCEEMEYKVKMGWIKKCGDSFYGFRIAGGPFIEFPHCPFCTKEMK